MTTTLTGLGHLEGRGAGDPGRLVPRPARGEELAGAHHVRGPQEGLGQLHHGQVRRRFLIVIFFSVSIKSVGGVRRVFSDCFFCFFLLSCALLLLLRIFRHSYHIIK